MSYAEFVDLLKHVGRDPSRLIFEDELTGIYNRRFLLSYFEHRIDWEAQEGFPLSLLILDLDRFKEINDNLGHEVGDQVLAWLASLLKEVGGESSLPVRFGGDEFVLLMPNTDRDRARAVADQLLERTHARPFRVRDTHVSVPITLSIGYATAPEDAENSNALYHAADMALLQAKQLGRDRTASAADVDIATSYSKTALYRLRATGIAGRDDEMRIVADALHELGKGKSQFVIFEGGAGMGKTTFLETIRANLTGDANFRVAMISGDPHENYGPYYLACRALLSLFNSREDNGVGVLERLAPEDVEHLRQVLPQLGEAATVPSDPEPGRPKGHDIFAALAKALPLAVDTRSLVLIVDDLHYADDATLLLLRTLIQSKQLKIFVCGSSPEFLHKEGNADVSPLERFYSTHHKELGIRRIMLRPLGEGDIGDYLRGVFPRLRVPEGFLSEIARVTQGSPLFLGELIRKLVIDRKIKLIDQEWVVEPLEQAYLPRSLDEIIQEQIEALSSEGQRLLTRASALGERIPLSMLSGSSGMDESQVLDILDRAENLGLVRIAFEDNDAVMRFPGKEVQQLSYVAATAEERGRLHEQVGDYQEGLYRQGLLPSSSPLAYHYARSDNVEKARHYSEMQLAFNQTAFDPQEASQYASELVEEVLETEKRLTSDALPHVPDVLRTVMSAVRTIQLYPPESIRIAQALHEVENSIQRILARNDRLSLTHAQNVLLVNGQRLDASRFSMLADSFTGLLSRSELQGIVFNRGVANDEIRSLVKELGKLKPETIDHGFWRDFLITNAIGNIELRQVRYSRLRRLQRRSAAPAILPDDERLARSELANVPKILRAFQGAVQNAKLYPLDSVPVGGAIQQLQVALQGVLGRRSALSLASVDRTLLVNGAKLDTAGNEALAASFRETLESVGLQSITFLPDVPAEELFAFAGALRDPPTSGYDRKFWDGFTAQNELTSLAFNQRDYRMGVYQNILSAVDLSGDEHEGETSARAQLARRIHEQPSEALREALPSFGKELVLKGQDELLRQLLHRLFEGFENSDPVTRTRTVSSCGALMGGLILGMQHRLTKPASDVLLEALSRENDPRVLNEFANLLHDMAGVAIQFADYDTASRLLHGLKERRDELGRSSDGQRLSRLLDKKLDTAAQQLLKDDLRSNNPEQQARAAQVLGMLGQTVIPLLIDTIKEEREYRTRLMIAQLLAELGGDAGELLKRSLVTEVTVEQRFRVLDVIDTVTRDLRHELAYSFGDASPKIRRAAFRLFERVNDDKLIDLVIPLTRDQDPSVAKGAIRSLAHLRTASAVRTLVTLLEETKESRVAIACCQALGELAHPNSIDALANVLAQRKPPFFRKRWDEQVRATAAMALRQIPQRRAAEVLSRYANDSDQQVQELARAQAGSA